MLNSYGKGGGNVVPHLFSNLLSEAKLVTFKFYWL